MGGLIVIQKGHHLYTGSDAATLIMQYMCCCKIPHKCP